MITSPISTLIFLFSKPSTAVTPCCMPAAVELWSLVVFWFQFCWSIFGPPSPIPETPGPSLSKKLHLIFMSQSKEKTEFHSIDVDVNENEEKDDDEDIVLHGSISKPLPKPANKYQSTSEKFFSNGSVISPSVQEEIYQKKLGNERKKQTLRQTQRIVY
jgi:hypothetical protein